MFWALTPICHQFHVPAAAQALGPACRPQIGLRLEGCKSVPSAHRFARISACKQKLLLNGPWQKNSVPVPQCINTYFPDATLMLLANVAASVQMLSQDSTRCGIAARLFSSPCIHGGEQFPYACSTLLSVWIMIANKENRVVAVERKFEDCLKGGEWNRILLLGQCKVWHSGFGGIILLCQAGIP